jgi:hypothetical protein
VASFVELRLRDEVLPTSAVELCLRDEVLPTSAVELRRREDIGDGGGIPGLGIVYLELVDV